MHISDLHFGIRFNKSKWDDLISCTKNDIRPDAIVITGDVVNSPWCWKLKEVRRELDQFSSVLEQAMGKKIPIRVIPGNHDTRWQGLIPIVFILLIALLFLGVFLFSSVKIHDFADTDLCLVLHGIFNISNTEHSLWLWASFVIFISLLSTWLCLTSDLKNLLGEYFLDHTEVFGDLRVGLIPFDSASSWGASWQPWTWFSSARGHIRKQIFVNRRTEKRIYSNQNIVWIALTHHHPLPLPYDHEAEDMMVMDNAGAFLSELTELDIKLVLHGHKHHQNFARISINPTRRDRASLAVLSAGTPTESNNPGAFRHGFNVIRIDENDKITIEMYEAPPNGGTFGVPYEVIPLQTDEEFSEERFKISKESLGVYCERMICIADINEFGDATFRREIYNIKTTNKDLTSFFSFKGSVTDGTVEAFQVKTLTDDGRGVTIQTRPSTCRSVDEVTAKVSFEGTGLQKSHPPVSLFTEFKGHNAFALNEWQLKCMRLSSGTPEKQDRIESVKFMVFDEFAVEELMLVIKFPETIELPKRAELNIDGAYMDSPKIFRMKTQNILQAIIKFPKRNANYEINWDVDGEIDSAEGQHAVAIREWLWKNRNDTDIKKKFHDMASKTLVTILKKMIPSATEKSFNVALFAYDSTKGNLSCIADNYENEKDRKNGSFKFGQGLPGRAFKSATVAEFIKPANINKDSFIGYIRGDGKLIEQADDIPESMILAFPLCPIDAPDWPYAVLQISTDNPNMKSTPSDQVLATVKEALMNAWTQRLIQMMTEQIDENHSQ